MIFDTPGEFVTQRVLEGPVEVTAPGVQFKDVKIVGSYPDSTLLTTGPNTRIEHCQLIGHRDGQHRGICVNSANVVVKNTQIRNIWHWQDAQAIGGWDGTANLEVEGCYLESSGENVMFGGADPSSASKIPQDIIIRGCTMSKPIAWKDKPGATVKNLFELKNAKRVLVENCQMSYSWVNGQTGFAILLTVRNQDGTAPYSTIEDVTFREIYIHDVSAGIQILGRDNNYPSQTLARVTFDNIHVSSIRPDLYGYNGRTFQLVNGGDDVTIRSCSFAGAQPWMNSALAFGGEYTFNRLKIQDCVFNEGEYGIVGDNQPLGTPALAHYAPDYSWNGVTVQRGTSGRVIAYPSGTTVID